MDTLNFKTFPDCCTKLKDDTLYLFLLKDGSIHTATVNSYLHTRPSGNPYTVVEYNPTSVQSAYDDGEECYFTSEIIGCIEMYNVNPIIA